MQPAAIFNRSLEQLRGMLKKIEAGGGDMLAARLHQDMLPFSAHVRAASNFALRGCCPLADVATVSFDREEHSFAALLAQIDDTMRYIGTLPSQRFDGSAERRCLDRAGFADIALPGDEYLNLYILPNFYFHFSMVYAIARSRGAAIGKRDFDGYHQYAPDFSFERPTP